MKKLTLLLVLVVAFAMMSGVALAAGPHGPFADDTALCAACHRAHTSSAEYLLSTPRVTALCIACHGGMGADTNVLAGAYIDDGTALSSPVTADHYQWGSTTSPLLGGGFNQVTTSGTAVAATSRHMVPGAGSAGTTFPVQWGDGTTGPGSVKTFLDCVDCHMPHRSTNYRMLRLVPTGYDASGGNLEVPSQDIVSTSLTNPGPATPDDYVLKGRRYTEDSGLFNTVVGGTSGTESISKWCGLGCHDFYYRSAVKAATSGSGLSGETVMPSTRVASTITTSTDIVPVLSSVGIAVGDRKIAINGIAYNVAAIVDATSIRLAAAIPLANLPIYSGTQVRIAGVGMEAYYDLDNNGTIDPTFMHAVDVDMVYTPRNGSNGTTAMNLYNNLGTGTYADKLPVADQTNVNDYAAGSIMTCLTCHRAHGTEVGMAAEAILPQASRIVGTATQMPWGSGAATNGSMLLRLPNRAVCETCHDMPGGF